MVPGDNRNLKIDNNNKDHFAHYLYLQSVEFMLTLIKHKQNMIINNFLHDVII